MTDSLVTRSAEDVAADRRALGNDEADSWRWIAIAMAVGVAAQVALALILRSRPGLPVTFGATFGVAAATFAWLASGRGLNRLGPAVLYGIVYGVATWAFDHYTMRR